MGTEEGPSGIDFLKAGPQFVDESVSPEEYGNFVLAKQRPEMFDYHPVGTGPYKLRSFSPNRVVYDASENYYKGAPSIPAVDIKVVKDPIQRPRMVAEGKCHIAADPDVNEFEKLHQKYADRLPPSPDLLWPCRSSPGN